ncbi:MAG: hypothetical protein KDK76_07170 [Chlamydiia bacterium]|nr:hypothetical protein [Chlamydiia bacterium]
MGTISQTKSYLPKDKLYASENDTTVSYHDEGHWTAQGTYYKDYNEPSFSQFENRDAILNRTQLERLEKNATLYERGKITLEERYAGFEDGFSNRVKGAFLRALFILGSLSVSKGLRNYDFHLITNNPKALAWANYSAKEVGNFMWSPILYGQDRAKLGNNIQATDLTKLQTYSSWHYNGVAPAQFTEEGKTKEVKHTVTASNDRNARNICMMRQVQDITTQESISYTGRADTTHKAKEQLEFIFQNELSKRPNEQKGLRRTENGYELTFMVNNLMSSHGAFGTGLTFFTGLDEREAVIKEQEIFEALSKELLIITDKAGNRHQVTIKPLYFNQGFNFMNTVLGKSWKESEINKKGYQSLFPLIDAGLVNPSIDESDKTLLQAAKAHLENPGKLLPEEEFFYRDLVMKILKLPVVNHCKSSTDRTGIALAISMALQGWRNLGLEIPTEHPHSILSHEGFKELFMANFMSGHQVTRVSRSAEGIVDGEEQLSEVLGYELGGNGIKQNPIAIRLFPDRYLDESKKGFNLESPLMKDRDIIKPSKMKMHYTQDHPLMQRQKEWREARRKAPLAPFIQLY